MDSPTARFVDDYLLYLLAQASAATSAAFHQELGGLGVTVATWRTLASLYPDARLSIGELARRTLIQQPTMTRQVDRLCRDGLAERIQGQTDRRGVEVRLTQEGRRRAAALIEMAERHEATVLARFQPGEAAALKAALRALAREDGAG